MIYRFEILTDNDEAYEGWAHNSDEMREKARAQLPPGVDFEVFLSAIPFQNMTLAMYRDCVAHELPDYIISELDKKIGDVRTKWAV